MLSKSVQDRGIFEGSQWESLSFVQVLFKSERRGLRWCEQALRRWAPCGAGRWLQFYRTRPAGLSAERCGKSLSRISAALLKLVEFVRPWVGSCGVVGGAHSALAPRLRSRKY